MTAKSERRVAIHKGAPRKLPRSAKRLPGAVNLSQRAEVTVVVRSRGSNEEWGRLLGELTSGLPGQRRYLTRAELARLWGASPADLAAVKKFGTDHGLRAVSVDAARRCVVFSGTLRRIGRAFSVDFFAVKHPTGTFRSHRGTPSVVASIQPLVECVLGLDNLPSAERHVTGALHDGRTGMNRKELLKTYKFPTRLHGKGQCIAIIELGGGLRKSDFNRYFRKLGIPAPRLRVKKIGGAKNDPAEAADIRKFWDAMQSGHFNPCKPMSLTGNPAVDAQVDWTIETTMDLAIAGTLAPEASLLLVQAGNDDQAQYHAVTTVIMDAKNAPSVLTCSWGSPEPSQTPALMSSLDRWFQAAAVVGMTVCFSSGDSGDGTMCDPPGHEQFNVCFPASSPHVLTVGGTTFEPKTGAEVAWKQSMSGIPMAGGGGFSNVFDRPAWQNGASMDAAHWIPKGASSGKGRAIPDVAAKADLDTAFSVIVGGVEVACAGTSSAVPLWAGLIAVLNQGLKKPAGAIIRLFYENGLHTALRDITHGNTGHFAAGPGWDPCTGWGSPLGEALLSALKGQPEPVPRRGSRR